MRTKIIFLLIILSFAFSSCNRNKQSVHPVRKDITQAVYASGKLFPLNHYTLISKFPGYVEAIHVRPGDVVKSGQALISIRNEVNQFSIENARNLLSLAKQNADPQGSLMKSLRQELASSRSKYELDSLNFHRTSALIDLQATSRLNFDQTKTQFDISKQNFIRAAEILENTREKLRIELLNSQNSLDALLSNRNDYHILSAISGRVYDVIPEIGDLVNPQMILMDLGDSTRFEVELAVDETDVSFLKPGQQVIYSIDAYRNRFFKGIVSEIYPRVNTLSKTSRIKATFEAGSEVRLYSGMSVEANIVVQEVKHALVIPKEFVKNENQVMVKGKDLPVSIEKGAEDLQYIEVVKGLDEQAELIKF